jgi:uncharacterized protein (DUF697 family)
MATSGHGFSNAGAGGEAIEARNAQARDQAAQHLIGAYVLRSLGIGSVPLGAADLAALFSQQLTMISSLGTLYGLEFCEETSKAAILTLVKAALPQSVSWTSGGGGLLGSIPLLGPGKTPSPPLLAGATSYALGQVFHRHFAAGGTLRSFDPKCHQWHFEQLFRAGLQVAIQENRNRGVR